MRHAYLAALHASGSATAQTGWKPHFFTLHVGEELDAACALYEKAHSYGEYVFDWAWANAYAQHGLPYYPPLPVPFTPVPGARLIALRGPRPCCRHYCAGANRAACRPCTCCLSTRPMLPLANKPG
jgi:hypothetical protein